MTLDFSRQRDLIKRLKSEKEDFMDTLERLEAKIRTVTREKNEIDDEKETIKRQLATYTRRCE